MSPRAADPAVRRALIDRAARSLVERQPLTLRRLAADVGVSTMAVYTHFGGMPELLRAVRVDAFERLGRDLASVRHTKDPVADLLTLGWAYCRNAMSQPDLYRVMFLEPVDEPDTDAAGAGVFLHVIDAVERCQEAGRIDGADAASFAVQLWGLTHGFVVFALRGVLAVDDMVEQLSGASRALLVGSGDEPAAADRSMRTLRRRMARDPIRLASPPAKPTLATSLRANERAR